jgi:hypothetical protein
MTDPTVNTFARITADFAIQGFTATPQRTYRLGWKNCLSTSAAAERLLSAIGFLA